MNTYLIAGHVVAFDVVNEETSDLMRAYEYHGDKQPEKVFKTKDDELKEERQRWLNQFESEIETYLLSRTFYEWILNMGGTYLHSCAIEMDGWGYAFTANSGVGKSTHSRLWMQHFGRDRVHVLNDDKPFIRFDENGVALICGSPWCGKVPENLSAEAPLKGICVLKQAKENSIRLLSRDEALRSLLTQIYIPDDEKLMDKALGILERVVDSVAIYELSCNISEDAAILAYQTMQKGIES